MSEHTMLFVAIYTPGPEWDTKKHVSQQDLEEHTKYMVQLDREGKVQVAGPLIDWPGGGLNVFRAASQEDADEIVRRDPAIEKRICIGKAHPWHTLISHNIGEFNHVVPQSSGSF